MEALERVIIQHISEQGSFFFSFLIFLGGQQSWAWAPAQARVGRWEAAVCSEVARMFGSSSVGRSDICSQCHFLLLPNPSPALFFNMLIFRERGGIER